jgi:hypothetical protein
MGHPFSNALEYFDITLVVKAYFAICPKQLKMSFTTPK